MRVLKFGGTSVGSVASINKVIGIVKKASQNEPIIVVVSALGGITDRLLHAGIAARDMQDYIGIFEDIKKST